MSDTDEPSTYELSLERIALIRRMVIAWHGSAPGAPIVHPEAPYGSRDRDGDIANVTGDDEGAEEEHRALADGIAVFAQNASLRPGTYQYHNPLAKLDDGAGAAGVVDVFRDPSTGETPEHITFAVGPEHLALIPRLAYRWDDGRGVPGVDPEGPYGGTASHADAMASILGEAAAPDAEQLARLHRELQPALQIFLRYADLGPGAYHRQTGMWVPA